MITKLTIENFQSHKYTELVFDTGVNAIVGNTDSGKSSIIRALKWWATNKPAGDEFRSWTGGDTAVSVLTSEGRNVTRRKTNTINSYELDGMEPFFAFKDGVPDEITQAINMDEINIQQQLDGIFLINQTPGQVAIFFNRIAKLEKIHTCLSYIQKEMNTLASEEKFKTASVETKKLELKQFDNLEQFEKELLVLENLEKQWEANNIIIKKLNNVVSSLEETGLEIMELENEIKFEKDIDFILSLYIKRTQITASYTKLRITAIYLFEVQSEIIEKEKHISLETDIDLLISLHEKNNLLCQKTSKIEKLYKLLTVNSEAQETALKSISELETDFHNNFPDVCPLCDTIIKKNGKKEK